MASLNSRARARLWLRPSRSIIVAISGVIAAARRAMQCAPSVDICLPLNCFFLC